MTEYMVTLVQTGRRKHPVEYALIMPAATEQQAKRDAKKEALRVCLCGNPLATYRVIACYPWAGRP